MKIPLSFFCLTFLFIGINLNAQTITGKVIDEKHQPISYVNIQLGANYGVLSNSEGVFVFQTPSQNAINKVTLSCLGYETLEIPLDDFKDGDYVLKEQMYLLDEVLISNKKLTPIDILRLVIENAPKNYVDDSSKQTFFLRSAANTKMLDIQFEYLKSSFEKKSKLKELNNDIETFTNKLKGKQSSHFSEFYGTLFQESKSSKLMVEKAIELKNKENDISEDKILEKLTNVINKHLEPNATYKVKSGIFPVEDSLKIDMPLKDIDKNPKTVYLKQKVKSLRNSLNNFYKNDDLDFLTKYNRYNYNIEGYATFNDETICIISFKPEKSSADYTGKIYVNTNDFAIVKIEYNLIDGKTALKFNFKFLLGIKAVKDKLKVVVTYVKNNNEKYAVNFVKESEASYFYVNRSLKFTKNKVDKKEDKEMLKFDFLFEVNAYTVDELFIINNESLKADEFKNITEKERFEVQQISKYTPSIWENYNILAPIEAIKNYK